MGLLDAHASERGCPESKVDIIVHKCVRACQLSAFRHVKDVGEAAALNIAQAILWVEAVHFDQLIFDTDDLSTIRGGSEAAICCPKIVFDALEKVGCLEKGGWTREVLQLAASRMVALVKRTDSKPFTLIELVQAARAATGVIGRIPKAWRKQDPDGLLGFLVPRISLAIGATAFERDLGAGMAQAERAARIDQLRHLSATPPDDAKAANPCPLDRVRPATLEYFLPASVKAVDTTLLSEPVALRRCLGRSGRRRDFYRRVLDEKFKLKKAKSFANDFPEIIEMRPKESHLANVPEQVRERVAILYLDANTMGKHVAAVLKAAKNDPHALLGQTELLRCQRTRFLHDLLDWADGQDMLRLADPTRKTADGRKRSGPVLRMETLLWGADEGLFVFPGWAVEPLLEKLAELLKADRWKIEAGAETRVITHAAGLVLCSAKAPIREVRRLAMELAEAAKTHDRSRNMLQYAVLGGVDMPTRSLVAEREAQSGILKAAQPGAYTLSLDDIADAFELIRRVKGERGNAKTGVPRNKLIRIRMDAIANPDLATVKMALTKILRGSDTSADVCRYQDAEGAGITPADFEAPALNGMIADAGHASLMHMLDLWHYVGIFDPPPPPPPPASATATDSPAAEAAA